jgi:hypothetical protein
VLGRRALVFGFVAIAVLAACQLIVGVEDEVGAARPVSTEGGIDAGIEDPCRKHHPPPEPSADKLPPGAGASNYVFAIRRFYGRPNGRLLGYDLDGRCTGNSTSTTSDSPCRPPKSAKGPVVDGDGGVDNALVASLDQVGIVTKVEDPLAAAANTNIDRGAFTNLIGLFGYNGQPNDDEIFSQVGTAVGLASTGCDGDGGTDAPAWDGCDKWIHGPGSIVNSAASPTAVWKDLNEGYVMDDTLVVKAKRMPLGLIYGELMLRDATMTARITRADGGAVLLTDGIVAGRALATDVIRVVQHFYFESQLICQSPNLMTVLSSTVCAVRDVPLEPDDDGRDQPCDAVSFAFGFDAELAEVGLGGDLPDAGCPEPDASCPE